MFVGCRFTISPLDPGRDILIAYLGELGFESFEDHAQGCEAFIQKAQFSEDALEKLLGALTEDWSIHYSIKEYPQQNWNALWESAYETILVDDRCLIRAPFHQPISDVAFDLVIQPKMSFGTGHHETTHMMVSQLLNRKISGKKVLDMGSGTGVLAILAAKKGAASVLAVDIEPWAVENCKENCAINQVDQVKAVLGDQPPAGEASFDLILANINKNILLQQLPAYARLLTDNGILVVSGFYKTDLKDLEVSAEPLGLNLENTWERNSWAAAGFIKNL